MKLLYAETLNPYITAGGPLWAQNVMNSLKNTRALDGLMKNAVGVVSVPEGPCQFMC
jgi:hypothetical protein